MSNTWAVGAASPPGAVGAPLEGSRRGSTGLRGRTNIPAAMTDHLKDLLARVAGERQAAAERAPGLALPPSRAPGERRSQAGMAALEREIAGENAHSLGKAGTFLAEAIAQANATRAKVEATAPGPERSALIEQFERERAHAEYRFRNLLIQREALGWRNHSELRRDYVIPGALSRE